jgi:hypothetical protein
MSAHRNRWRHGDGRVGRAGVQAVDDVARSARFSRWSLPVFAGLAMAMGGLKVEGRIGLSPALLNSFLPSLHPSKMVLGPT